MPITVTASFWLQIIVYIITLGFFYGKLSTEMKHMKEKLDKHNSFQDRLVVIEERTKYLCEDVGHIKERVGEKR